MVLPVEIPKKKVKRTGVKKGKKIKKVSSSVYENTDYDLESIMRDIDAYTSVADDDDTNVGLYAKTYGEPSETLSKSTST